MTHIAEIKTGGYLTDLQMLDVTEPEIVEIQFDPKANVVWVNVDGICRFRACRIKNYLLMVRS